MDRLVPQMLKRTSESDANLPALMFDERDEPPFEIGALTRGYGIARE